MKNKQYNRLFDRSLKLVIATLFSFSLINSPIIYKLTDISEFESVAYAKKSKEEKQEKKLKKQLRKQARKLKKQLRKQVRKLKKQLRKQVRKLRRQQES